MLESKSIICLLIFVEVHSRFPITRFPVTRPPFYERVTPLHNEQTIDPSSPTTTEWSALEFETLYFSQISQFFIPSFKFVKISIFLLIKIFRFFWKYPKMHLISVGIFIITLLYFYYFEYIPSNKSIPCSILAKNIIRRFLLCKYNYSRGITDRLTVRII